MVPGCAWTPSPQLKPPHTKLFLSERISELGLLCLIARASAKSTLPPVKPPARNESSGGDLGIRSADFPPGGCAPCLELGFVRERGARRKRREGPAVWLLYFSFLGDNFDLFYYFRSLTKNRKGPGFGIEEGKRGRCPGEGIPSWGGTKSLRGMGKISSWGGKIAFAPVLKARDRIGPSSASGVARSSQHHQTASNAQPEGKGVVVVVVCVFFFFFLSLFQAEFMFV